MPLQVRTACPLCRATESVTLISLAFDHPTLDQFLESYFHGRVDRRFVAGGHYTIDRCNRCEAMWQREILDPEGMELLYAQWIEPTGSLKGRTSGDRALQFARHCARLLRLFPDPANHLLLDYGMGWGDWCHMAQSFGFQVHGVELSQERVDYARALGISASLPKDLPEGPYDFVYLEQVMEHVPEPYALMERLVARVKPGGYVHIGVPNGRDIPARAADPSQLCRKGPAQPLEHINIFTNASLRRFMEQFHCTVAAQRESLLRATSPIILIEDLCLAAARFLPATVFPKNTSLLFRKAA